MSQRRGRITASPTAGAQYRLAHAISPEIETSHPEVRVYAMILSMGSETTDHRDVQLLTIALDHATRLYESRMANGHQVLNYFLVATAVLSTAYVSAINGKLHLVGFAVGLLGMTLAIVAYLVGRRQRDVARLAEMPMKEIQEVLADSLDIDSLRMSDRAEGQRTTWWRSSTLMANAIFTLAAIVSVTAAIYALLSRR
jgi:hypothetical protein